MPPQKPVIPPSLYDPNGQRKYLTAPERQAFLQAAKTASREVRTLCETLTYTGCRLSEALELTADRVDLDTEMIIFESLKKRSRGVYRAVPVPAAFLDVLGLVHNLRDLQAGRDKGLRHRLWPWSRMTGWRRIGEVMKEAGIEGAHASAKGLRHGFGVTAVTTGIPLNLVQKWLGHAQLSTTAIYADAVGDEEHEIAARMWRHQLEDVPIIPLPPPSTRPRR